MNKIYDAKTTFSNDADLGSFVRKLWNEMDNGTNQQPKTFA